MRAPAYWRFLLVALLAGVFFFGLNGQRPAHAGGPLLVGGTIGFDAVPFKWSNNSLSYTTDQGGLGTLDNATTNDFVRDAFAVWESVPNAGIRYQRTSSPTDLGMDVTGANALSFFNSFEDCLQSSSFTNAIVFDTDGSVTDALLGEGSSSTVLGFAGPVCLESNGSFFARGEAVLNGRFIDGMADPDDISINKFKEVIVHELGHLSGLDHSQINVEVLDPAQRTTDNLSGLPLMFPFLLSTTSARVDQGFPPLAPDDEASLSWLYPGAPFGSELGHITGTIFFSDGVTPVQGVNVIARQIDDPMTPEDESRRTAVSRVSGYLFTGNPGQDITGTNMGGSPFGSRNPGLIGFYTIDGLPAGDYTIEVESINLAFGGGSSVGPLNPPIPMPGTALSPAAGPFVITLGTSGITGVDITLVNTPPRFDQFEN